MLGSGMVLHNYTSGNGQQATDNSKQATDNRQQATDSRHQATANRHQATDLKAFLQHHCSILVASKLYTH